MAATASRTPDGHGALGGLAVGPLGLAGQALLAEPGDGLVHVAVVLLERLLGVEHADAGHLAELLDVLGGEGGHGQTSSVGSAAAGASASAARRGVGLAAR